MLANNVDQTGPLRLDLHGVNAATGFATNTRLASATVLGSTIGRDLELVTFTYANPKKLVAGRQYALILAQPESGNPVTIIHQDAGACPGSTAFIGEPPDYAFTALSRDLIFVTVVKP